MDDNIVNQQAKNLTKAIFQHESGMNYNAKGDAGTSHGAGQWQDATWKAQAKDVLGDQNAPMTKENQSIIAQGTLRHWVTPIAQGGLGLNAAEAAAKWNSGSEKGWQDKVGTTTINGQQIKYNVPLYVKSVTDLYQGYKGANGQNQTQVTTANSASGNQTQGDGTAFPYKEGDSALTSGLKAIGNTPQSALNFGKGVAQSINPLKTIGTIGEIGSGFSDLSKQEGTGKAISDVVKGLPKAAYDTLVPQGVRSLLSGDTSGAAKAFTNDPFGQAAPLVFAAEGGAKLADNAASKGAMADYVDNIGKNVKEGNPIPKPTTKYSDAFDTTVSKVGGAVAKPLGAIASAPIKLGAKVGSSVLSHLTGLDPTTMTSIISDPKSFSKVAQDSISRPSVAEDFGNALDQLASDKAETGSQYQGIRADATPVKVPPDLIPSVLDKFGLKLSKGKILADTKSVTRNISDINALQKFVNDWGGKKTLTPHEFLNMRSDLADLANYDKLTGIGKTRTSSVISDQLRQKANEVLRPQVKGLKELDAQASPQIQMYKQAKKDFLNADGTFKDGAINKIANAKNLGKENLLSRMEAIRPGITKSLQVLKAVEDIQKANGIKVGTYTRSMIEGGGLITGNIPVIISAILTHPTIAVQILRGFGVAGKGAVPIVTILKKLAGDVNKGKLPVPGINSISPYSSKAENNPVSNVR